MPRQGNPAQAVRQARKTEEGREIAENSGFAEFQWRRNGAPSIRVFRLSCDNFNGFSIFAWSLDGFLAQFRRSQKSVMKITSSLLLSVTLLALGASNAGAALIAYWNFNGLLITTASNPGSGGVPTSISADSGTGTVGLSGWGGTVDDFAGSTINALNSNPSEESLSLIAGGPSGGPYPGNGTYITINFSMTGYENPVVTFATRGTSTGFDTGTWSWSANGTNFTPIAGVNTATRSTSFALATVDLSTLNILDRVSNVTLRYTLSGATSNSGNNRIDNIQVNATAVPETSAALLGALGVLGMLRRRR